ncbi:transposase-like protein [Vibrio vulnificus]|nr:transposase-like protein [Vibrio vulnificus]
MFGQSQTDVLEKLDRPEQLIFQIGIIQQKQKDLSISAEV